jgi:oligopeptide transport system substrate-binding protein
LSVDYIGFNCTKAPFDDLNVRLAFCYDVNKDKLVNVSFAGTAQRADGLLPPGMPGFNKSITGAGYDVAKAKDLIAKSKYGSADKLPPITITVSAEGGAVAGYIEAIASQWEQDLGVDITIRGLEQERFTYALDGEVNEMFDFGWIADYPHPQDFLDILFHSGASQNYGMYKNTEVDALLDKANSSEYTASLPIYQQAEQKMVADGAFVPLFFGQNDTLVKPYVQGYKPNALGFVMLNTVSVQAH